MSGMRWILILITFSNHLASISGNPYITLGVDKTANEQEIKRAYRKLAIQYHPDKVNLDYQKNWSVLQYRSKYLPC